METSESQTDFITRALLARDEAKATGEYYSAEEVLRELDDLLASVSTNHSTCEKLVKFCYGEKT
ncbi:MAG: hypothetical protein PHU06_04695 [Gallionella sp.]|nr:hypothetical protein [Gallionella sp.]MDD4959698.1 hypothetical protein [Gallionella sp.]